MIVGIIGAGQMGAAVAARCAAHGARVITPIAGRSPASAERAAQAGMEPCDLGDLAGARLILSLVPSSQAPGVAQSVLGRLGDRAPPFIEANALAPETKRALAAGFESAGARLIDAVIVGLPPSGDDPGPRLYLSGAHAPDALVLRDLGLDARLLDGPVGTAAALKMCYAGMNKGITALAAAVLIAAQEAGIAEALVAEWGANQMFIRDHAAKALPAMYPKAARWVSEFEEIARFAGTGTPAGALFAAFVPFFQERAKAHEADIELPALMRALSGDQLTES